MKFRLRVMDAVPQGQQNPIHQSQSSSPSSPYTCFNGQAVQGFPTDNLSGCHVGPEMFRGRFDMRDTIQRQLEKEKIRQEILADEMARKRILEEEVRQELKMEREMIAMRSAGGFPSPVPLPPTHNNLFEPEMLLRQPIGLEERIIMSIDEKNARCHGGHPPEIRGFDVAPFQGIPTPVTDSNQKELIVLGKPNGQILTGVKRRSTPSVTTGESSESCSDTSKKRITEEWSCAICQVTATSERGLNEHLQGKKHQLKEAALIVKKTGPNFGLGMAPNKPVVKPVKLAVTTVNVSSGEKKRKRRKASGGRTPSTENTASVNGSNEIKKEERTKAEKNKDKFNFWCEMCKVGAFSEKVMDNHKGGKKHSANLVELVKKGKPDIPCEIVEKTGSETKERELKPVEEEESGVNSLTDWMEEELDTIVTI